MLKLERATINDAQKLAEIQKTSFNEESKSRTSRIKESA